LNKIIAGDKNISKRGDKRNRKEVLCEDHAEVIRVKPSHHHRTSMSLVISSLMKRRMRIWSSREISVN